MRRLPALALAAAVVGSFLGVLLPSPAEGSGQWVKFLFTPQAGTTSACLTCGWQSACVAPYPWGPALDFVGSGSCYGASSVWFRAFGFRPPGSPSTGVGRAAAEEVYGTLCKTVKARIWDTGSTVLGEMWYVHTGLNDPRILFLTASGNGDENEQVVAYTVDPDNQGCIDAGYWTPGGAHLHEYHVDYASTFFLRNNGNCGATCNQRFPCAPSPANCLYNPQDWSNDWTRGLCVSTTNDSDCDEFTNTVEQYLGTDLYDNCPDGPTDDAWPLDINKDRNITVTGDVLSFGGRIGATPGVPNWWKRLDFNADGRITVVGDVLKYAGKIGQTCT